MPFPRIVRRSDVSDSWSGKVDCKHECIIGACLSEQLPTRLDGLGGIVIDSGVTETVESLNERGREMYSLLESEEPLTIDEIDARLDTPPMTVYLTLEELRSIGLMTRECRQSMLEK